MISPVELFGKSKEKAFMFESFDELDTIYDTMMSELYVESSKVNDFDTLSSYIYNEGRIDDDVIMEDGDSIFASIGRAVKSLIEAVTAMFNGFFDSIRDAGFSNKSDIEKLDKLCKKNPSWDRELREAFASGALKLSDIKSYGEAMSKFNQLEVELRNSQNPKGIKAKWDKAMDAIINSKTLGAVRVAGDTAKSATGFVTLFSNIRKEIKIAEDEKTEQCRQLKIFYKRIEEEYNKTKDPKLKKLLTDRHQCELAMRKDLLKVQGRSLGVLSKTWNKINEKAAKILDAASSQKSKDEWVDTMHTDDPHRYDNPNNKQNRNGKGKGHGNK